MPICKVDGQMCILYKPVFKNSDGNNYLPMQYNQFSKVANQVRGKINVNNWVLKMYLCLILEW